jgi:REP-associated tyrosine transposase
MPRTARASVGDYCYHVMNRGNGRAQVFHVDGDYQAFISLLDEACGRTRMRLLSYCLMPDHFHLAVWPYRDGDLSRWMQWLLTAHVRRYHRWYESSGHVWQGRFKAFPIEQNEHLLMVLRYIEQNPVRAGLVSRAEHWPWSSARLLAQSGETGPMASGPVARPTPCLSWVNDEVKGGPLDQIRMSIRRGTPYGSAPWVERAANALGLEGSLRPLGRPRKPTLG